MKKKFIFIAAVVFCGLGEMTVNNFLAALNIPTVTSVTFKRREREVGSIFEAVANKTCNEALCRGEKKVQYKCFFTDLFQHMIFFQ